MNSCLCIACTASHDLLPQDPKQPIGDQMNKRVYWLVRQPPTQSGATGDSVGGGGWECKFPERLQGLERTQRKGK